MSFGAFPPNGNTLAAGAVVEAVAGVSKLKAVGTALLVGVLNENGVTG